MHPIASASDEHLEILSSLAGVLMDPDAAERAEHHLGSEVLELLNGKEEN